MYLQPPSKKSWRIFCPGCLTVLPRWKVSTSHQSYLPILPTNSVSDSPESCCPSVVLLLMEDELPTGPTRYRSSFLTTSSCHGICLLLLEFLTFYFNNCKRQNDYADLNETANNKAANRMALRLCFLWNQCLITNRLISCGRTMLLPLSVAVLPLSFPYQQLSISLEFPRLSH